MKCYRRPGDVEESFLLLKLDTIKAFDCLGWSFLTRLLGKIGLGPNFIRMIESINTIATSSVLIQGRLSVPIPLKRSIRQGCPMSPLLFLIVANAMSLMISMATDNGLFRGVPIEETWE